MTVNLSIKNVPDSLADALRTRADRNHRSLQGELMAILERAGAERGLGSAGIAEPADSAAMAPVRGSPKLSIDEVAQRAAKLFPKGTSNSVRSIRAMRDGRYGDKWTRTGRHVESE